MLPCGSRAFDFQRTLDNLYAKQHPDGFICREIVEADGSDLFWANKCRSQCSRR